MFTSSIVLYICLIFWIIGAFQRIIALKRYGKEVALSDYLHVAISLSMLVVPAAFFCTTGTLNLFLGGFALAWVVSTVVSMIVSIVLIAQLTRHTINLDTLAVYAVFLYAPVTAVMIIVGLYLDNPFAIGAAFSIATLWVGYIAQLMK
jgi:hypothetical protein